MPLSNRYRRMREGQPTTMLLGGTTPVTTQPAKTIAFCPTLAPLAIGSRRSSAVLNGPQERLQFTLKTEATARANLTRGEGSRRK
jgi:hypothetical protein